MQPAEKAPHEPAVNMCRRRRPFDAIQCFADNAVGEPVSGGIAALQDGAKALFYPMVELRRSAILPLFDVAFGVCASANEYD